MPTKTQVIEDVLGAIEEQFYKTLAREEFEDYLGAKVEIIYSMKPRISISIREAGKPGPRQGQKFKPRIGPSLRARREMAEAEAEAENEGQEF